MQPHLFTTSSQILNKGSAVESSENLWEPIVINSILQLLFFFLYLQIVVGPWSPLAWPLLATALKNVLGCIVSETCELSG